MILLRVKGWRENFFFHNLRQRWKACVKIKKKKSEFDGGKLNWVCKEFFPFIFSCKLNIASQRKSIRIANVKEIDVTMKTAEKTLKFSVEILFSDSLFPLDRFLAWMHHKFSLLFRCQVHIFIIFEFCFSFLTSQIRYWWQVNYIHESVTRANAILKFFLIIEASSFNKETMEIFL